MKIGLTCVFYLRDILLAFIIDLRRLLNEMSKLLNVVLIFRIYRSLFIIYRVA